MTITPFDVPEIEAQMEAHRVARDITQAAETAQLASSHAAEAAARPRLEAGPQATRRVKTVAITDDSYVGFTFDVWLNFPRSIMDDIQSGDSARSEKAVRRLILRHNGWRDFDGNLMPQPHSDEFWEGEKAATVDLQVLVSEALTEAINESPLVRRQQADSASGSAPATKVD